MTPGPPRVYLDEDVDVLLAALLSARGFDVVHTVDERQVGNSDNAQLRYSTENGRGGKQGRVMKQRNSPRPGAWTVLFLRLGLEVCTDGFVSLAAALGEAAPVRRGKGLLQTGNVEVRDVGGRAWLLPPRVLQAA